MRGTKKTNRRQMGTTLSSKAPASTSRGIPHAGNDPMLVGAKLRERRRHLNLTLQEVADRVGVTKGFLSELERDREIGRAHV